MGSCLGKEGLCSLKLSTTEERRNEQNCFSKEIIRTKVTKPKTVLGSCLGEDIGFGDNYNFFYDIQRHIPSNQACVRYAFGQ